MSMPVPIPDDNDDEGDSDRARARNRMEDGRDDDEAPHPLHTRMYGAALFDPTDAADPADAADSPQDCYDEDEYLDDAPSRSGSDDQALREHFEGGQGPPLAPHREVVDARGNVMPDPEGGLGGAPPPLVGVVDGTQKMERMMGFKSDGFVELRAMLGEAIRPDAAERAYLADALAKVTDKDNPIKLREGETLLGDKQHYNVAVRENGCVLCPHTQKDIPRNKDWLNAYNKMILYDLEYCGAKEEAHIFQECANIFNRMQERAAAKHQPDVFYVTADEVQTHLCHNYLNIKRPCVRGIAKAKAYQQRAEMHVAGTTYDGKDMYSIAMAKHALFLQEKQIDFTMKLSQATMFIDYHVFGKATSDLLKEPEMKRATRHFAGRPLEGAYKKQILK